MPEKTYGQLVTEIEAAQITGRAVQTMRNDRHKCRGLPYIKLGRSVRYSLKDIQAYIQKKRIDPEARG